MRRLKELKKKCTQFRLTRAGDAKHNINLFRPKILLPNKAWLFSVTIYNRGASNIGKKCCPNKLVVSLRPEICIEKNIFKILRLKVGNWIEINSNLRDATSWFDKCAVHWFNHQKPKSVSVYIIREENIWKNYNMQWKSSPGW